MRLLPFLFADSASLSARIRGAVLCHRKGFESRMSQRAAMSAEKFPKTDSRIAFFGGDYLRSPLIH